tara:strand:- start:48 stop:230 length:183 start_codon:yes stop_codon:yes gene_type:complete
MGSLTNVDKDDCCVGDDGDGGGNGGDDSGDGGDRGGSGGDGKWVGTGGNRMTRCNGDMGG